MDQKPEKLAWGNPRCRSQVGLDWTGPFLGCPEGAAWMKWENPTSENILVEVAIECGKWWLTSGFRGTIFSEKLLCKWYMQVILGSSFLVQYQWHWYSPVFSHVLLHKTRASLAAPTYRHLPFLVWTPPTIVGATGPLCRLDGHYKGQLRLGKTSRLRKIILYLVENSTAWRLFPIFGHTGEWQDTTPGFVTGIVTNWSTARILDQTETKRQRQNQNRVGKSTKQWLVHGDFHNGWW